MIVSLVGVFLFALNKADANRDPHDEFNLLGFIGFFLYLVFSPWQSVEVFGGYFDMEPPDTATEAKCVSQMPNFFARLR